MDDQRTSVDRQLGHLVHLGRVPSKADCDNCIDYRTDPSRNAVEESERLSVFKSYKRKQPFSSRESMIVLWHRGMRSSYRPSVVQ